MSVFALDQDSHCSYEFYQEQQEVIDEMCNRLGYNFTVTSAARYGNKLAVRIKNTDGENVLIYYNDFDYLRGVYQEGLDGK